MHKIEIKDRTRVLEILAVVLTGMGKFILMDWLDLRFVYISGACLFWMTYVFLRTRQTKGILSYWGFAKTKFRKTFIELLPIVAIGIGAFLWIANRQDTNVVNWSILPILLIYPIWGIVQQFIIVGLISRNLKDLKKYKIPQGVIVLFTSVIFAVVHYPHLDLVFGTFLLAILYSSLYLRGRNLIVLGIYHGWLGAFFFYTVMGRDAWQEVFGKMF